MRILKRKVALNNIGKEIEIQFSPVSVDEIIPKTRIQEVFFIWSKKGKSKKSILQLLASEFIQILSGMSLYELSQKILEKHLKKPKIIGSLDMICSKSETLIRRELINYIIKESLEI